MISKILDRIRLAKGCDFSEELKDWNVVEDCHHWAMLQGLPYIEEVAASFEVRSPSRTVPEQLEDALKGDRSLMNCFKEPWERHKLVRLYSGEVISTPSRFRVDIPRAGIHVKTGTVFLESGDLIKRSTVRLQEFALNKEASLRGVDAVKGDSFSLLTRWANNYAHWLFDSLPRLDDKDQVATEEKFVVPPNMSRFHRESLELLGIPENRWVVPTADVLRVERLSLVSAAITSGVPNGQSLRKLRERFREAVGLSSQPATGKPLYILREKPSPAKSQRRLINEPEVRRVLMDFGFEVIVPEDLSFEEQVRKFAEAPILVGPHGAGNFNLMYMAPGASVVELFNPECWEHTSVRLSGMLELRHYHLFGVNRTKDHLFEVDPQRLRKLMCLVLGGEHLAGAVETVF